MYRTPIFCFFFFESHVIREIYGLSVASFERMELVGPQMVLTMKLTTFAWNVSDGRRKVDVRLSAYVFMNKERGLKCHSGIRQTASRKKDHKIPILT